MTRRFAFAAGAIVIVAVAFALRTVWLESDPPAHPPIGIVWHDEGAWVHNARNRALWGVWRMDEWNPVFVTPVFTALEYVAFELFGVGTWQARTVPIASGIAVVICLMGGLAALAGPRAALAGGALAATNYVFVMWNRAALIESTMTAFVVAGWCAYARADRRPAWALAAGAAASLAWFTKAAAAFFIAALVAEAAWSWVMARSEPDPAAARRRAILVIAGLAGVTLVVTTLFVWPYWPEYQFYNWQMSVTRKPAYTLRAIVDRATWLPLVQSAFAGMWPVCAAAMAGLIVIAAGWRHARPADRLLVLWLLIGLAELVAHDAGNERRYVMFIPALIALGVRWAVPDATRARPLDLHPVLAAGLAAIATYLLAGSALRIVWEAEVTGGQLSAAVRTAAAAAASCAVLFAVRGHQLIGALNAARSARGLATSLVAAGVLWNVGDYRQWMTTRTEVNVAASRRLGEMLPPGTLVQGKLAAGMALENRIRPLFIGNGFGNYADRLTRDDVRYILTYDLPRIGYESSDGSELIEEILRRYPERRTVGTFEVDESPDRDRAVLIDKNPTPPGPDARD